MWPRWRILLLTLATSALGHSSGTSVVRLRQRRALEANESVASLQVSDHGDLTCMKWTGGTCPLTYCKEERGPTVCVDAKCMCQPGYCANALGECEEYKGDFIGAYAIAFEHAYMLHTPYVGAEPPMPTYQDNVLVATDDSKPQWNVVVTARAHVRFESKLYPGNILTIYQNRRRRSFLIQTAATYKDLDISSQPGYDTGSVDLDGLKTKNRTSGNHGIIVDSDAEEDLQEWGALRSEHGEQAEAEESIDLIPILMPFERAHPIQATFRVRPTDDDGGGYEIWHPQSKVVLSSADPELMFVDPAAQRGIGDCAARGGSCEGHQLVVFRPPLPDWVTPPVERKSLYPHGMLHWWQIALIYLCIVLCIRLHFDSWEDCCKISSTVLVCTVLFFFAIFAAILLFLAVCGAFCKKSPVFVLGIVMLIVIGTVLAFVYFADKGFDYYQTFGENPDREEEQRRLEVAAALERRREEEGEDAPPNDPTPPPDDPAPRPNASG